MKKHKKIGEPLRAVAYIRVSTDEQAQEGQSLDNQLARIRAYADSQGWPLIDIYREEGYSGKTTDRPQLARLITDLNNGHFDIILVYKVDRLTRKQKDLWHLLEDIFEPHNVGFKSVIEPFDTTTAQGKAFLGMLAVFAQLERDTISERTKDTLANKKTKREWVGRPPFGFRIDGSGHLIKDPTEQKKIELIKRLRTRGLSYRAIAERAGVSYVTVGSLLNGNLRKRNNHYGKGLPRVDC